MSDIYANLDAAAAAPQDNFSERVSAPPGSYDFAVYDAKFEVSEKSQEPMYKLQLRLMDERGETPWGDVFTYIPIPTDTRREKALALGRKDPTKFLSQQMSGFFRCIGWDYRKKSEGGRDVPRTEMETRQLINLTGKIDFRMGKPDGEYPAKLEPRFAYFQGTAPAPAEVAPAAAPAAVEDNPPPF